MQVKQYRYFACDFETTVYEGQTDTQVWSAAIQELYTDGEPLVFGNINSFFEYVLKQRGNICLYFHNLKFDGAFILDYLFRNGFTFNKVPEKEMLNNEFKCAISAMGQFYNIIFKKYRKIIEIRDSLKLLPFALDKIAESFKTKHKKLEMEYKGYRYPDCPISDEELQYIKNDIYVLKEALELMFNEGHTELTIGACCLKEFKRTYDKQDYDTLFPNIYDIVLDEEIYGAPNAGEYVRKSYRGGWCYLKPGHANEVKGCGNTYDVNSLYPSMMHSESGNLYPVGKPQFWSGSVIPTEACANNKRYFVRFRCRFTLKEGYLPTVQIKHNLLYKANEYLTTSDIYYNGEYHRYYTKDSEVHDTTVEMTMTQMDFEMLQEHYELFDLIILDGCYFYAMPGIFDEYINFYKELKMTSTGSKRELAKLYLNNLYGKEAASTDSSYKMPYLDSEKDCVRFTIVSEHEKKPGYIPCGSYITSYSRCFTITAAQANYENFVYSDTDSIHLLNSNSKQVKGIKIHEHEFCCWKNETSWDTAIFVRQKTYIEHVTHKDGKPVEPRYDVKCAGMPKECKKFFLEHYTMEDFHVSLCLPGKLRPKRIKGGILLVPTTYEMK